MLGLTQPVRRKSVRADTAVIVNPVAGHGRTRQLWPSLARAIAARGLKFDASFTTGPAEASRLAAEAARSGYSTVVSVGGDGTLNEVVNGLLSDGTVAVPTLGVISSGTGGDLVRTLGIPHGVPGAAVLGSRRTRVLDVGLASYRTHDGKPASRYFVNSADLGIGAVVSERVNRGARQLGGFLSFFSQALAGIIGGEFVPVEYTLDGGPKIASTVGLVFAANGRFAAHAMMFAPQAELDDGKLDVLILRQMSKLELLFGLFPKVYRGTHVGHPKVYYGKASRITVSASRRLLLELDGEVPGQAPVEIVVVPAALRVLVPELEG
jgi:YegS/Rv2252/BmrU family lipid kinase